MKEINEKDLVAGFIPDYSAGRNIGLTDEQTEEIVNRLYSRYLEVDIEINRYLEVDIEINRARDEAGRKYEKFWEGAEDDD